MVGPLTTCGRGIEVLLRENHGVASLKVVDTILGEYQGVPSLKKISDTLMQFGFGTLSRSLAISGRG